MKKIYKTNLTTIISVWIITVLCFFGFFLMLFIQKISSLNHKIIAIFGISFFIFLAVDMSLYKLIINDETITSKSFLHYIIPFLPKSVTFNWNEIKKINILATLFAEGAIIFIYSKDLAKRKQAMAIPFISGIPANAVQEILSHIPKDVEVRIDPALKKYIENPRKMYRYNVALGIILVVIVALWTFWIFVFHNPLEGKKPDFRRAWEQTIERTSEKYK